MSKILSCFFEGNGTNNQDVRCTAHALDKDIIVMTQTKNIVVSTKYCDLGEETVFVAFEVAPVLLVGTNLAGKLVGGMHAENVEIFIN